MKIVAFAGGVGGAKFVDGLAQCLPAQDLSVIVNTGDDFEHFGLYISPDLDTVCYTLAELANPKTGWGRKDESWTTLEEIRRLGGSEWFNLGDRDLATHLERTQRLSEGQKLSTITQDFCLHWGVNVSVYPMSDDPVRTYIHTQDSQRLPFQEYFVKHRFEPVVRSIEFEGIEDAAAPDKAIDAIHNADFIILCPSNPFVSIDPILQVGNISETIKEKKILAISPLIGEHALKGPAAKMFHEFGKKPSSAEVARHYQRILHYFILDDQDEKQITLIKGWGIMSKAMNIYMPDRPARKRLAKQVLEFLEKL